jgi:hypothetical protein
MKSPLATKRRTFGIQAPKVGTFVNSGSLRLFSRAGSVPFEAIYTYPFIRAPLLSFLDSRSTQAVEGVNQGITHNETASARRLELEPALFARVMPVRPKGELLTIKVSASTARTSQAYNLVLQIAEGSLRHEMSHNLIVQIDAINSYLSKGIVRYGLCVLVCVEMDMYAFLFGSFSGPYDRGV